MTDTTTVDETSESEELPELVESEHLGADGTAEDTPLKTRVLLPFLVPLLSIAIVAVLVLNISRVFLAGNKDAALGDGHRHHAGDPDRRLADRGRTPPARPRRWR